MSSVPLRSPFRYPGGKTWLVPSVRLWIRSIDPRPAEFIEPFAGGGIIGLTCAFDGLVDQTTIVELDSDVASVWETMLGRDASWLSDRILAFALTRESAVELLARKVRSRRDVAFATLLKNRINRGGILAPGATFSRYGERGKGIASRWYPQTLSDRILGIYGIRDRLHFIHGDGLEVLRANANRREAVFFIDPPYTAAGKKAGLRLYRHSLVDHDALFEAASRVRGDFLMTYDDTEEVKRMAKSHGFETVQTLMKSTHHTTMTELLIGRDLRWARDRTLL